MPTFQHLVEHIIPMRSGEEVSGVAARWVVTCVTNKQVPWQKSDTEMKHDPMRFPHDPVKKEIPITF